MSDVLHQALREMKVGEEIIVSQKTFNNIRDRFNRFRKENRTMGFVVRPDSGLQKISRRE